MMLGNDQDLLYGDDDMRGQGRVRSSSPNGNENQLINGENWVFLPDENSSGGTESESDSTPPPSPPQLPDNGLQRRDQGDINVEVVDVLIQGKNLLAECPPGLDRQTTILTAILNFWNWKKERVPLARLDGAVYNALKRDEARNPLKIYVATRDFREMKKIIGDIRRDPETTQFFRNIKMSILGHREDLCINEDANNEANVNHACRKLLCHQNQNFPSSSKKPRQEQPSCDYYRQNSEGALPFVVRNGPWGTQVSDIEDLMLHCRQTTRCPYFDGIHLAEEANLVFLPVEFLLSPSRRQEYSINLDNTIIFIDDGYDLENSCKKEASIDITLEELNSSCSFLRSLTADYQQNQRDDIGLLHLETFFRRLFQWLNVVNRPDRSDILQVINELEVNELRESYPGLMRAILEYAKTSALDIPNAEGGVVEKLMKLITTLIFVVDRNVEFTVKVTIREPNPDSNRMETVLQIICANPALIFKPVEEVASSVIVGSNIIAPYSPFNEEFDVVFEEPVKVHHDEETRDRLFVAYAQKGVNNVRLTLDYDSRDDPDIKKETGLSLLKICETTPYGRIALFHSKDHFQKTLRNWRSETVDPDGNTIWNLLEGVTQVFCEFDMRTQEELDVQMEAYQNAAREKTGALLLALQRDDLYKNWDLKYDSVRTIVHISLPFGPWKTDDDIITKRAFFERREAQKDCVDNKYWYHKEAFRILNQSFCYTLNEKTAWGVVIVFDDRMHGERHEFNDRIPEWVNVKPPTYFREFAPLINDVQSHVERYDINGNR